MIATALMSLFASLVGTQTATIDDVSVNTAPQWSCTEPKWKSHQVTGGKFQGVLTSDCSLTGSTGGGLPALDQYLLKDAVTDVKKVNGGPFQETFENLPSVRYDITTEGDGDEGPVTVRSDIHVATDLKTKLVRATFSKSVQADGYAGLIRKLDVRYEVIPNGKGNWSAHIENTLHVEKPWYAPEGMFQSEVEKNQISTYKDTVKALVPRIAAQL